MAMGLMRQAGTDYGNGGTYGPGSSFRGNAVLDSERYRMLDRRQSYYDCTQHDYKRYDFDGRIMMASTGISFTQPMLTSEKAPWYVPMRERRPSAPCRIGKVMVEAFTNLVFGVTRFPEIHVHGDEDSQDFVRTVARVAGFSARAARFRNLAGAMGSAGISWCWIRGRPRIAVHNATNLYVNAWEDRELLIPKHVIEVYTEPKDEPDPRNNGRLVRNWYWRRRDWTKTSDVVFKPVLFEVGKEPDSQWEPDFERSVRHDDGVCHFEWAQNIPSDDVDGLPDYDGLYENMDELDMILSVISRGAKLNLDPTLVLKMDPDKLARVGVKKGSDHSLAVGEQGDAKYLELEGSALKVGVDLFNAHRKMILEVGQCIIPDPQEIAAEGVSSVAIKAMFRPMDAKANVIRDQLGGPLARVLTGLLVTAQEAQGKTVTVYVEQDGSVVEKALRVELDLPPKVEREPVLDDDGNPSGEDKVKLVPRSPGEGEEVELEWPDPFPPTPQDIGIWATTLTAATAGQPFISPESAAEEFARARGKDGKEEWVRMQKSAASAEEKQAKMFADHDGDAGGKVEHEMELPGGAKVKKTIGGPKPPPPMLPGQKPGGPPPPGGDEGAPDEEEEKPGKKGGK